METSITDQTDTQPKNDADFENCAVEVEKSEVDRKSERNLKIFKLLRTGTLVASWASMGLCSSLIGPTQIDLQERLGCDTTFEDMSKALSAKNVGTIVGSSVFSVIHDRFRKHCDIIIATSLFMYGFAVLLKPWATELWVLAVLYFIEGIGHGSQNVGGNAMIMMTWGKDGNAPMHALHFGFGLGGIFGPLLASPFLSADSLCENEYNTTNNATIQPTSDNFEDVSEIEIAYAIASLVPFTLCAIFVIFFLVKPPKHFVIQGGVTEKLRDVFSPGRCAGGATGFVIAVLTLIGIFWLIFGGNSFMMGTYIFTYAVESDLGFDKDEAALMNSAYLLALLVARGISIPISHFVPIVPLLFAEVYLFAAVTGCLAFFGSQDKTLFWIFVCLYSGFEAVIYPGGVTWLDKYVILMSVMIAILDIAANVGAIAFVNAAGYIFTYKNPNDMLYLAFAASIFLCVWLVIMQVVASRHGNRYVTDDVTELDTNNDVKPEMTESKDNEIIINHYVSDMTENTPL